MSISRDWRNSAALRISDVCEILSVSRRTMERALSSGRTPKVKVLGITRVPTWWVLEEVQERSSSARPESAPTTSASIEKIHRSIQSDRERGTDDGREVHR